MTDRVLAAWSESTHGVGRRVCTIVTTTSDAGNKPRCQPAPGVDVYSVDVAAGAAYDLITWTLHPGNADAGPPLHGVLSQVALAPTVVVVALPVINAVGR